VLKVTDDRAVTIALLPLRTSYTHDQITNMKYNDYTYYTYTILHTKETDVTNVLG